MRLFVRAAGWERGYYWTEVTAKGTRDAGQVPVESYFDLLRNQDSLAPSLSVYQSAAGYHVLCLGLATRRNEPTRRVITNSLLIETADERTVRLFVAAILATGDSDPGDCPSVFQDTVAEQIDECIDHDDTQDHYRVEAGRLHGLIATATDQAVAMGEPEQFPDDVFFERLFARNTAERRRELQAALCRYELPALVLEKKPRLLLAISGREDAEKLCGAGAWIALSDRCEAEGWGIFTLPGQPTRKPLWDRC
jgi:hypothetical protein